ncbi:MAG: hypothetical protein MHM6MM_009031 [Cercozoa sp. M6MM]
MASHLDLSEGTSLHDLSCATPAKVECLDIVTNHVVDESKCGTKCHDIAFACPSSLCKVPYKPTPTSGPYKPAPTTGPYEPMPSDHHGAPYATMTLEEATLQLKTLSKKVADLEHVDSAPSAGVGCASQCQSAMAAKVPHLCPKWCTGISSKPSLALSVLDDNDNLAADTTTCLFSGIFQAIGDDAALGLEHSVLLGFRMPIVKKAGKVRASLRIGVEGVVEDDDIAKFWMANVDDDSLPKLIRDTAAGTPLAPVPKNCAADGYIVGKLLNKGLVGEDKTLVKSHVEGALLDIDMSADVQKLVNGQHWQLGANATRRRSLPGGNSV